MQEDIVRSHADESARQANDVVRPVTYFHGIACRNSISLGAGDHGACGKRNDHGF
jgi:hypothetical protein